MYRMPKWTVQQKHDLVYVLKGSLESPSFPARRFFVAKIRVFGSHGGYSATVGKHGEEAETLRLQRRWGHTPKPTWS